MKDKKAIEERTERLVTLTAAFCEEHLNDEYRQLCEKLVRKMARKKNVPFMRGKEEAWAAAVVHTIGRINFLFDRKTEPYVPAGKIAEHFGVSKATVSRKAGQICEMFDLWYWDSEFSTNQSREGSPLGGLFGALSGLSKMHHDIDEDDDEDEDWSLADPDEDSDEEEEGYVLNFECNKCGLHFDSDVGGIAFLKEDLPMFEKEIDCPECGERSDGDVSLTKLGRTQLAEIYNSDDEDGDPDEQLEKVMERVYGWGLEFSKSPHYEKLTETQKDMSQAVVMGFADFMHSFLMSPPERWTIGAMEACCLQVLPGKIIAEPDYFEAVSPVLGAFFDHLAHEKKLPQAAELSRHVRELHDDIVRSAADPNSWGPSKTIATAAMETGVDPTDEKQFESFIEEYNRKCEGSKKVGRNDPCPCGSGKKFKKCCGKTGG